MTVSYNSEAATATFYNFAKLLLKWRGSVWKLIGIEMLVWSAVYFSFQAIYYFALRVSPFRVIY
jgi:hypothetical protein